jgi:hypothetical protein
MGKMDGTLDLPWNIIDVIQCTSLKPAVNALWKQFTPPPIEVAMSFQSSKDLTNPAAKQLTHALLNPQPAGPFDQVSDDQMLALE